MTLQLNRAAMPVGPQGYPKLGSKKKGPKKSWNPKSEAPSAVSTPVTYRRIQYTRRTSKQDGTVAVTANIDQTRSSGLANYRTFVKNPDWRQKIAKGLDASASYTRTVGKVKPATYNGVGDNSTSVSQAYGALVGSVFDESGSSDVATRDLALARLKRRISGYTGGAALGPPLGESKEIHGLVRQINDALTGTIGELILLRKNGGRHVVRRAGQIWLFFGFGVNPLLGDVAKAAQAIAAYTVRKDRSVRVSGTASRDWISGGQSQTGWDVCQNTQLELRHSALHKQSYRYAGAVDIKVAAGSNYSVMDHLGLKITALPSILWELTVFSWVIDYGATVGPWLDDMFWTLPGNLKYLNLSTRYENKVSHDPRIYTYPGTTWKGKTVRGETKYTVFTRQKLTALPTASLRIKSVDEVASHGLTKVTNLASVLASGRR